ncbi:iron chelate uptake ABC transporter family permease subunit [Xinfangfangia sp. CPCC 101601]|uniref:Iron chelate uptake ABC transporter family permease subunit n=1 Tax=Pseudogemmobacter lacusdianii TaxID=3069608 RepID=A0ABU0W1U9_9RHOB|nr:iron chelate uptake ABC transporter family permease subunit [Xinfangfangia sp. CPCC 101601]MDQ2067868.1 iron chelate uptake ABC transporter family permease subunit [Xinfangfangia sp. CPCC 101601]
MIALGLGLLVTAVLAMISLLIGAADTNILSLLWGLPDDQASQILMISRLPRTLALILAGSSLGIAGLVMQMIVRNRFVEPSTTGTTESAMLGFLVVTLLAPDWPIMGKMLVAAGFALMGMFLFLRLLKFVPLRDVVLVPLVGIMLAGVIGAITSFFAYRFNLLPMLLGWSMGDFSGVLRGRYELLWIGLGCTIAAGIAADRFTVAGMGREFTTNLGLNYRRTMLFGLVIVSLIASVCLVSVGSIPFLGLVVPNVVSLILGDNMRRAVPWVAVGGAAFVLAGDILGRVVRYPYEVPISVVVGVIGSAFFILLLLRRRTNAA